MKNKNDKGKKNTQHGRLQIQENPQVHKINDFPNTSPYAELSAPPPKQNVNKNKADKSRGALVALHSSSASETSLLERRCWPCRWLSWIQRTCPINEKYQTSLDLWSTIKKWKYYFMLKRNRLWGIEIGLCPHRAQLFAKNYPANGERSESLKGSEEAVLGSRNCHLDLLTHPSGHPLVGLSTSFQTMWTRSKFNSW